MSNVSLILIAFPLLSTLFSFFHFLSLRWSIFFVTSSLDTKDKTVVPRSFCLAKLARSINNSLAGSWMQVHNRSAQEGSLVMNKCRPVKAFFVSFMKLSTTTWNLKWNLKSCICTHMQGLELGNHVEPNLTRRAKVRVRRPVHVQLVTLSPLA